MPFLSEFTSIETIHSGRITTLRARERDGNRSVLLRLPAEGDEEREVRRHSLVKEYHIHTDLDDGAFLRALRLIEGEGTVLVLEDPGGDPVPIDRLRLHRRRQYTLLCTIGLKLLSLIDRLQARSILHLNVNPSTVWYSNETENVYLFEFQFAARMNRIEADPAPFFSPDRQPGFLAPEQTGLVRQPVDLRTDLYSTGATLYYLFTGKPPFADRDATILQHRVIASLPDPPGKIDPHIPESISAILMKSLAKDPRERYHSTEGMRQDLEEALALIQGGHTEEIFQPGRHDRSAEFRLPTRLYGREEELALLKTMYEQAREGQKNVLLIQGSPGCGKTVLVLEMQREVALAGGFFATGRPGEGMQARPTSFVSEAIEQVLTRILTLPERELAEFRHSLLRAIPAHRSILTEFCPSLEWIIGKSSDALPAGGGPGESLKRLTNALLALFRVLSPRGSPLLLFFDDLHRADSVGLDLLLSLVEEPTLEGIFFVLAMRGEEARGAAAEFPALLARRYGYAQQINLPSLTFAALREYVEDLFDDQIIPADELATILYRKTGGNPFYARETLQTCYEQGWIRFDGGLRRWLIDFFSIERMEISDNVVALLSRRIRELPEEERALLEFAAIVGETFDLFTLYWVSGWTPGRIFSLLRELYRLDFIRPEDAAVSALEATNPGERWETMQGQNYTFRFTHERIRRAAYDSSDDASRTRLHAYAGIHLLEFATREPAYLDNNLFRVVGHLNAGRIYLDDRVKRRLLSLDLKAGLHALQGGDPEGALGLLRIGLDLSSLLDAGDPEVFQIRLRTAEVESLTGSPAAADALFQGLLERTTGSAERMEIYRVRIPLLVAYNRFEESIDVVRAALERDGLTVPRNAESEIPAVWNRLRETGLIAEPERLTGMKELDDPRDMRLIELLCLAAVPALAFDHRLLQWITLEAACILSRGCSPFAPQILSLLFSICPPDYDAGTRIGKTAKRLIEKRYTETNLSSNLHWYSLFVSPFVEEIFASIPTLEESIRSGYTGNNYCYAGRSAVWLCTHSLVSGQGLEKVFQIALEQLPLLRQMRQEDSVLQLGLWMRALGALRGESPDPVRITGPEFREEEVLPLWESMGNRPARFLAGYLLALLRYIQDDLPGASGNLSRALPYIDGVCGTILEHAARFLECLILFRDQSALDREVRLRQNASEFRTMAFHFPRLFGLWHHITTTLLEFLENRRAEAVYHLEEALAMAGENGRLVERALTEDLLYEIYRSERKKSQEILYFTEALSSHRAWGCGARLRRLVEASRENANLLLTRMEGWRSILSDPALDAEAAPDARLLLEASGAIAKEVSLEGVVHTILGVLLRLSGAERALFFYRKEGRLRLVAEGSADAGVRYDSKGSDVFDPENPIPHTMLLFSLRTGKPVLEHNAFEDGEYAADPYIAAFRVRSTLCMPLLRQGQVQGILYLENRRTGHTFHPARIELLRQLSGQMVVSLANADHYESLEGQIRERTHSLKESLSQVEILKQQQDVDYYLISILLYPLLENAAAPDRFLISFLIRQKKRFRFKKWMVEIGGDLCFGAPMTLGLSRFSVIVNADAMGKSLQGSGGALVLGSVLKALVERTRLNPVNVSPREWLLSSVQEIHQVFATFNGLMFVTIILALLEEETNTVYYINAGHPRPILYRGGTASFFGNYPVALKPGMKYFTVAFENVEAFCLEPGDILFFGSDGKDDIILGNENGNPIMNEDDEFFLRVVERATGNQRKIYRELRRHGTLSDDLTLIRIERPV